MARTIDKQTMLDLIIEAKRMDPETGSFSEWLAEYLVDHLPTLTPPNEALTLEQLREMDGEPVWDENGKCYLVDTTYRFCSCSDIEIAIVYKNGDVKRYPQRRALYRRPPEGEEEKP